MANYAKLKELYEMMKDIDPATIDNSTIDLGFDYLKGQDVVTATDELFVKYMGIMTLNKFKSNKVIIFNDTFDRVKSELLAEATQRNEASQQDADSAQALIDEINQA